MNDILFSEEPAATGKIGFITLNRLNALNALTYEMIVAMQAKLIEWQDNKTILSIIVCSNSKKAFCAGGDVVKLHEINKKNPKQALDFFRQEYLLNCLIRNYSKPYICLLDGFTIGGGVGISLHGSFPVATENFSFSMPETGIGFFPDVGGGYLLTRCKSYLGLYLGLTGKRIGRQDALFAQLIQYTIKSSDQNTFIETLLKLNLSVNAHKQVQELLNQFKDIDDAEASLHRFQDEINKAFNQNSIKNILLSLANMANDWSYKTIKILEAKSPLALALTFEQLRRVKGLTMEETMAVEYKMAARFLENSDFCEGVRALLVDKDLKPNWQSFDHSKDNQSLILPYFEPLEQELF